MLQSKGKFIFKQEWYSICSRHFEYNCECDLCKIGKWQNVYINKISSFIYDNFPELWRWWVNLKFNKIKFFNFQHYDNKINKIK